MGTQSAAALTETWGVPAPTGFLYLGIDIGRRKHLAAAIPEARMWDGSWERAPVRTIATTALGFRGLTGWLGELSTPPDQTGSGWSPPEAGTGAPSPPGLSDTATASTGSRTSLFATVAS